MLEHYNHLSVTIYKSLKGAANYIPSSPTDPIELVNSLTTLDAYMNPLGFLRDLLVPFPKPPQLLMVTQTRPIRKGLGDPKGPLNALLKPK